MSRHLLRFRLHRLDRLAQLLIGQRGVQFFQLYSSLPLISPTIPKHRHLALERLRRLFQRPDLLVHRLQLGFADGGELTLVGEVHLELSKLLLYDLASTMAVASKTNSFASWERMRTTDVFLMVL